MNQDTQTKLREVSHKLATFRDKLDVKLNLAEKDAKVAWNEIKPSIEAQIQKVDRFSRELETKKDEVELHVYLGIRELADKLDAISPHIDKVVNNTTGKITDAQEKIDIALLRAELAKLEAIDYFDKKRNEIADAFKSQKDHTVSSIHSAIDKASNRFDEFTARISG